MRQMKESTEETIKTYILMHQNDLYRLAYSYTKNSDDALDIVQESVYKALVNSSKLKTKDYVKTWIYRIVVNESLNYLKKQKRLVLDDTYLSTLSQDDRDPSVAMTLYEAIQSLDPLISTVIKLRFYEDLKLEEIAQIMESNLSTTKTRLYKGLDILKNTIGDDFMQ